MRLTPEQYAELFEERLARKPRRTAVRKVRDVSDRSRVYKQGKRNKKRSPRLVA